MGFFIEMLFYFLVQSQGLSIAQASDPGDVFRVHAYPGCSLCEFHFNSAVILDLILLLYFICAF